MEKDVDAKQHELTVIKAANQKDFTRLQELTKLVNICFIEGLECLIL